MHLKRICRIYNKGRSIPMNLRDLTVSLCIISSMGSLERSTQMSIRLSDEEVQLRDKLAHHFGIDHAGVMRMGLLRLARAEEITAPERKKAAPEGTARRKR